MKKQTVVLIWAAALLLLVVTCFGIYFVLDGGSREPARNKNEDVFSCLSTDIESYTVLSKDDKYTIEKEEKGWEIEDDSKAELDQSAVEKMIASASKITATGTISRKQLADFDTSDSKTVRLEIDDREDVEIRFLGTSQNFCAFRISGDAKTYLMYESVYRIMTPNLDSLRITSVFPRLSAVDTLPQYYSYTDSEGNTMKVRLKNADELSRSKDNKYLMEKPFKYEVDDELFEQQIVVKIPLLKGKNFIKNPEEDKSVYGLTKDMRSQMEFEWDNVKETLYLGNSQSGAVYAMKAGEDAVFMIDSALVEFLEVEPFYILESGILKTDYKKIVSVSVKTADESYDISVSGKGTENARYYINQKAASSAVFDGIAESLAKIRFIGELVTVPEDTKDIQISIRYSNVTDTHRISLVKTVNKSYAVFVNGKAEFEVDSKAVDELIEKLDDANKNPMKMD